MMEVMTVVSIKINRYLVLIGMSLATLVGNCQAQNDEVLKAISSWASGVNVKGNLTLPDPITVTVPNGSIQLRKIIFAEDMAWFESVWTEKKKKRYGKVFLLRSNQLEKLIEADSMESVVSSINSVQTELRELKSQGVLQNAGFSGVLHQMKFVSLLGEDRALLCQTLLEIDTLAREGDLNSVRFNSMESHITAFEWSEK